jgi:hypothetical protein
MRGLDPGWEIGDRIAEESIMMYDVMGTGMGWGMGLLWLLVLVLLVLGIAALVKYLMKR